MTNTVCTSTAIAHNCYDCNYLIADSAATTCCPECGGPLPTDTQLIASTTLPLSVTKQLSRGASWYLVGAALLFVGVLISLCITTMLRATPSSMYPGDVLTIGLIALLPLGATVVLQFAWWKLVAASAAEGPHRWHGSRLGRLCTIAFGLGMMGFLALLIFESAPDELATIAGLLLASMVLRGLAGTWLIHTVAKRLSDEELSRWTQSYFWIKLSALGLLAFGMALTTAGWFDPGGLLVLGLIALIGVLILDTMSISELGRSVGTVNDAILASRSLRARSPADGAESVETIEPAPQRDRAAAQPS